MRLKATTTDGGFALRLIGDGDLGEALNDAGSLVVEMEDGRVLRLYDALLTMISSRVTGFIVLTERHGAEQLTSEQPVDDERQVKEWSH